MHQIIFEVKESSDGSFAASALGYRIQAQGEDWEELKSTVRDSVRSYFEAEKRPAMIRLMLLKEEVIGL